MKSIIRNIIILVVLTTVGVVVYQQFFKKETAPTLTPMGTTTESASVAGAGNNQIGRDFLSTLLNLKTLRLNDEIFSNASFSGLVDFSRQLTQDEPEGRPNPFAPIGVNVGTIGSVPNTGTTPTPAPTTPETPAVTATVTTNPVTQITATTATFSGSTTLTTAGLVRSFELGKTPALGTKVNAGASFTLPITALTPNTLYYVRAVVTEGTKVTPGETVTFTTLSN